MKKAPAATAKTRRRSDAMRERLIEAATEVFAERGYDGAAVSRIARRAGVTTGAIYAYFSNKAELLLEVIRTRLKLQIEPYKNTYDGVEAPDSNELFLNMTRDRFVSDRPLTRALLLETFAAARRDPDVRAVVQDWLVEVSRPLADLVRRAQKAGMIDESIHAPTLAWFYMISGAGEAFTEAAGMRLPRAENYLPLMARVAGAFRSQPTRGEGGSSQTA
jgi:AcrR family transcriptional regulator